MSRRLRSGMEIALWRYGVAWPLAGLVGCCAAAVYFLQVQPGRQVHREIGVELARERAKPPSPVPETADKLRTAQQRVHAVKAVLQYPVDSSELVRKMALLAEAEQISLAQSDYQQTVNAETGVARLQITQPVRASYPQLRRYIEAVLVAVPNASLDQVVARRESVTQHQVEARVVWSIWSATQPPTQSVSAGSRGVRRD